MKKTILYNRGFTIVELLVVIVVIGILAGLVLNSFAGAQDKARAAAVVDGIRQIEKSLRVTIAAEGMSTWWNDQTLKNPADGQSSVTYMMTVTPLGNYLRDVPKVSGFSTDMWEYDNDLDTYDGCSADSKGVNIQINTNNRTVEQMVDNMIDDGNLSCGKVRVDGENQFVYSLSRSGTVQ